MYKKLLSSTLTLAMLLGAVASSLQGSFLSSYLPSNVSSSLPTFSQENRVFILGGLVATLSVTNGYLLYRSCKTEQENELEKSKLIEGYNAEIGTLQTQCQKSDEQRRDLETKYADFQIAAYGLQEKSESATEQVERIKAESTVNSKNLRALIENLQQRHFTDEATINAQAMNLKKAHLQISVLTRAITELKKPVEAINVTITQYRDIIEQLEKEIEAEHNSGHLLRRMNVKIKSYEEKIKHLEITISELEEDAALHDEIMDESIAEIAGLKQKIEELLCTNK